MAHCSEGQGMGRVLVYQALTTSWTLKGGPTSAFQRAKKSAAVRDAGWRNLERSTGRCSLSGFCTQPPHSSQPGGSAQAPPHSAQFGGLHRPRHIAHNQGVAQAPPQQPRRGLERGEGLAFSDWVHHCS